MSLILTAAVSASPVGWARRVPVPSLTNFAIGLQRCDENWLSLSCLADTNRNRGLAFTTDSMGTLHLSRFSSVTGDLIYTTVGVDGAPTDVVVDAGANAVDAEATEDTDIILRRHAVHLLSPQRWPIRGCT